MLAERVKLLEQVNDGRSSEKGGSTITSNGQPDARVTLLEEMGHRLDSIELSLEMITAPKQIGAKTLLFDLFERDAEDTEEPAPKPVLHGPLDR